ncbi:unnamed protein product, partial [Acanthoscelides obtectus]
DTELGQLVESKISHALDSIVVQINELKSTVEQAVLQNPDASSVNKPISYAIVLRNKTVPAVIIKPKEAQDTSKTKTDILQNVNLVADEIHISKIKHVKDGGVLIGCKSDEGNLQLKKLVQEKMVGSYGVKDVGGVNPRKQIHQYLKMIDTLGFDKICDIKGSPASCEVKAYDAHQYSIRYQLVQLIVHIGILKPNRHGDEYIHQNEKPTLNVQATCDAREMFTSVDVSWPGSVHDSRIWRDSQTRSQLINKANVVLLGHDGYGIGPWLRTPFRNPTPGAEINYNKLLNQERVIIDRCFSQLKRRFPILQYVCRVKLENVPKIIIACIVLHNVAKSLGDPDIELVEQDPDEDEGNHENDELPLRQLEKIYQSPLELYDSKYLVEIVSNLMHNFKNRFKDFNEIAIVGQFATSVTQNLSEYIAATEIESGIEAKLEKLFCRKSTLIYYQIRRCGNVSSERDLAISPCESRMLSVASRAPVSLLATSTSKPATIVNANCDSPPPTAEKLTVCRGSS